ncbi:MAG TPA: hypothetical protein VM425_22385 [Myxococcota bacterium]|nr:hypothetical protein [Myxococcota bacterium]
MKTFISLVMAVVLLGWIDFAQAQEDTGGTDTKKAEEEKKVGTDKDSGADTAADPWETPKATEEAEPQPEETTPEVVVPRGYPVSEIDRPLALPRMTLEPRLNFDIDFFNKGDNWFSTVLGTGFGVIDNLEAGIDLTLSFAPHVYAGMRLYGLYEFDRFLDGKLLAAGRLQLYIPFSKKFFAYWGGSAVTMLADAPVKFKLSDIFAVIGDLGLGFLIGHDPSPNYFLLKVDAGLLVQPIEPLAISLEFGVLAYLGEDSDAAVPMTIKGQYTMVGDLDVFVDFTFADLTHGADRVQLMFGAAYRLGL